MIALQVRYQVTHMVFGPADNILKDVGMNNVGDRWTLGRHVHDVAAGQVVAAGFDHTAFLKLKYSKMVLRIALLEQALMLEDSVIAVANHSCRGHRRAALVIDKDLFCDHVAISGKADALAQI